MAGWLPLFAKPETRVLKAEGASFASGGSQNVTLDVTPFRAPFSPELIKERIAQDPEYYRRLALHLAAEFGFAVQKLEGQTNNSVEIVRGELVRLQEGFAEVAQSIGQKAYAKAAEIIVSLRDGLASWWASHPELVEAIESLSVITLGTVALHQFGCVDPILSSIIAASVVKKEKLSDILGSWNKKRNSP